MKGEERQKLIRDKAIPVFVGLKIAEILTLLVSTVGVYFYGVLIFYLLNMVKPNWFLTWITGLSGLAITVLSIVILYLLIGKCWLIPNWNWDKRIAQRQLEGKK